MTKSHLLPIFKCQYLIEILRYGANFLHVIITFIGFKITFSNIRSHGAPLLISRGWRLAPPPRIFDAPKYVGFNRVKMQHVVSCLLPPLPPPVEHPVSHTELLVLVLVRPVVDANSKFVHFLHCLSCLLYYNSHT